MYELIQHQEVGAGGASSITFSGIPQIYTDLYLVFSARSTQAASWYPASVIPNGGVFTDVSYRRLYGTGSAAATNADQYGPEINGSTTTASTFSSVSVYIPNYRASQAKCISIDMTTENNATAALSQIMAGLWNNNDPITSLEIKPYLTSQIEQYTTATLYGVGRRQGIGRAPLAIGGYAAYDNGYWYHSFPSSGSFEPFVDMDVEYLVIAGGGGGGYDRAGGGGAGGYRSSVIGEMSGGGAIAESRLSLAANASYSVSVGAGGSGATSYNLDSTNGSSSSFYNIISIGGGNANDGAQGGTGGSGGGGFGQDFGNGSLLGGPGTDNQGFRGGNGVGPSLYHAAGGGGAGSVGENASSKAGNGGDGLPSLITGTVTYRAGGGGGGKNAQQSGSGGSGGFGGGGNGGSTAGQAGSNGVALTGGGGGGGSNSPQAIGGNGGSGIVIVRYKA